LAWLDLVWDERFDHKQLLTAKLGGFWSLGEVEMEPGVMSGVILVGRTTNWPKLSWFGWSLRVDHEESIILAWICNLKHWSNGGSWNAENWWRVMF
jgi:hypothetical protein